MVKKNHTMNNIFNIGSDQPISIAELAKKISKISNIKISSNKKNISNVFDYYVPNINKIKENYTIEKIIKIDKSLLKIIKSIVKE